MIIYTIICQLFCLIYVLIIFTHIVSLHLIYIFGCVLFLYHVAPHNYYFFGDYYNYLDQKLLFINDHNPYLND